MFRIIDKTGRALEAVRVVPCSNERESWARVITCRGEDVLYSELSWPLARRIVPKLLERYGITDNGMGGLFTGSVILV